jgi:hypothetical protein
LVVRRSTLNVTGGNWSKFGEIWKCHIFWPYLTSSGWNWPSNNKLWIFLESTRNLQSKKVPYRYIGQLQFLTFIWKFFTFKASGLPTNLKKKIKYAEIDFTPHHSFLRVRRDQFLPNCKKNPPYCPLSIVAMKLWSQWPFESPIQNVKKGAFRRILGAFWKFLYGITQRPFDPNPPLVWYFN